MEDITKNIEEKSMVISPKGIRLVELLNRLFLDERELLSKWFGDGAVFDYKQVLVKELNTFKPCKKWTQDMKSTYFIALREVIEHFGLEDSK